MADTSTTHLNLIKQDPNTAPDIEKTNANLDEIDTEIWKRAKTFNGTPVGEDGGFNVDAVPFSDNLRSAMAQVINGTFITRSTGGDTSIDTGDAWLTVLKGRYTHVGYVPMGITMSVVAVQRAEEITATIDNTTFENYVTENSIPSPVTLTYGSNGWSADPALYGITVSGTPVENDVILVTYTDIVPGTITQSNPQKFISTGWNLYDNSKGYAHVVRYSSDYGFKISGDYSGLEFSPTTTGSRVTIIPVGGGFNIPSGYSEGYVFVSGGNNTNTAIWMTHSDWGSSYDGSFQTYTEDVIDLTYYMLQKFPYGLMAVGTVQDEININAGYAVSRVQRLENNATNLRNAMQSGRQYDYDTNYVYLERETYITYDTKYTISSNTYTLDGAYAADDHGMEMFTVTTVAVEMQSLYGNNLKNKLERDVVTKSNDLVDNLTTNDATKALTAKQGKALKDLIDPLNTTSEVTGSTNFSFDTDYVESTSWTLYKCGRMRMFTGTFTFKAANSGWQTFGTMASAHRPVTELYTYASDATGGNVCRFRLTEGGALRVLARKQAAYVVSFTYFV